MNYKLRPGKLIFSALGIKHLPPGNFFANVLFKKIILPRYIRLELTHKCNLRCAICPSFLRTPKIDKEELTFNEIKILIDELSSYKRKPYVSVSGGEPFLRLDIFDILKYLEASGLKYKILSNATVLMPALKNELKEIKPDIFQVSLDGPEQIHDKVRNTPGAFAKTIEAVLYIKENTRLRILLMCVINSINVRHLFDMVKIAQDINLDLCFSHLSFIDLERFARQKNIMKEEFGIELSGSRSGDINDLRLLDVRLLSEQIARIRGEKTKINIYFTQELSEEQIAKYYTDSGCCVLNDRCYYPWFGARIDPYGMVSVCREDYLAVGNILEEPLSVLYNNDQSNKFRDYLRKSLLPLCLRCCWCGCGDSMTTVFGRSDNLK